MRKRSDGLTLRDCLDPNPLVELLMGGGHLLGAVKLAGTAVASGGQRLGTDGIGKQKSRHSGQVSRIAGPVGQARRLARTATQQLGKGPGS